LIEDHVEARVRRYGRRRLRAAVVFGPAVGDALCGERLSLLCADAGDAPQDRP
jgi:hypothetical protein